MWLLFILRGIARHGDHLLGDRVATRVMVAVEEGDDTKSPRKVARNLKGLSMGVLPLPMREISIPMQRHRVGVPEQFLVPLMRLARVVICYHEQ